ncbi:hypothetical protein TNCV_1488461 [Trichonephila clavipes]|nr:hypothetical protein TNCV_1488461 [Trichonephila clavipes]
MLSDSWGHLKWNVPIHVTGWKFLKSKIPFRYVVTKEETSLYVTQYRKKKLYLKERNYGNECLFQRMRDEMYVLSIKQQHMIKEIKKVKKRRAYGPKGDNKAKLNEMKAKNDLIQKEKDILKVENDVLKSKEQEWKTKRN